MAWVHYHKLPIYPIFYLLKRDYTPSSKLAEAHSSHSGADHGCGTMTREATDICEPEGICTHMSFRPNSLKRDMRHSLSSLQGVV